MITKTLSFHRIGESPIDIKLAPALFKQEEGPREISSWAEFSYLTLSLSTLQNQKKHPLPFPTPLERLKQNHPQDQTDYVNDTEKTGWSVSTLWAPRQQAFVLRREMGGWGHLITCIHWGVDWHAGLTLQPSEAPWIGWTEGLRFSATASSAADPCLSNNKQPSEDPRRAWVFRRP